MSFLDEAFYRRFWPAPKVPANVREESEPTPEPVEVRPVVEPPLLETSFKDTLDDDVKAGEAAVIEALSDLIHDPKRRLSPWEAAWEKFAQPIERTGP
ncbi:hypothetical protein ABGB18_11165 [Nonomuraea sp. B12E4]|uniref:hypothetical protein n=1 Tax=Nonomuraea sp. B12E4 TaxID=3153564 RepID=UPI00325DF38E